MLFVDVVRPLPFPESLINRLIIKAIGISPFVLDAKRNQEAWERRYRDYRRRARRAAPPAGLNHPGSGANRNTGWSAGSGSALKYFSTDLPAVGR